MVKFLKKKNSKTKSKKHHSQKLSKRKSKPKSKSKSKSKSKLAGGQCVSCGSNLNSNTFRNYMENLENQMSGGGYSVNLMGENIGNRPVYSRYSDTNPPVTDLKGNLMISPGDAPACGMYGGRSLDEAMNELNELHNKSKKTHKRQRRKRNRKTKGKSKKSKSKSKSRKPKKSRKSKKGGFMEKSNFNENLKDRKFDCNQPSWSPDCV